MSNVIRRLQNAFRFGGALAGEVVRVEAESIQVRTKTGLRDVTRSPGDATQYRPGDAVSIDGGFLRGRRQSSRRLVG